MGWEIINLISYLIKVPKGNTSFPGSFTWHLSSLSAPPELCSRYLWSQGCLGMQGWVLQGLPRSWTRSILLFLLHFAPPGTIAAHVGLSGSSCCALCHCPVAWKVLHKHLQYSHETCAALVLWDGRGL